ncbi:hypothetical protein TcYC6_0002230 [Trypanosoma cruzi]|nr:hypothetical protein TcYC6_0002230 [Trypanosoma cruzi]
MQQPLENDQPSARHLVARARDILQAADSSGCCCLVSRVCGTRKKLLTENASDSQLHHRETNLDQRVRQQPLEKRSARCRHPLWATLAEIPPSSDDKGVGVPVVNTEHDIDRRLPESHHTIPETKI